MRVFAGGGGGMGGGGGGVEWGHMVAHDAGNYSSRSWETGFFKS